MMETDAVATLDERDPDLSGRLKTLCVAAKHRFDMPWDDAIQLAEQLDDMFNGRREIDDEELDKDLRAMFYDLQAKDILTTRREEFQSPEGKTLRAFYWRINEDALEAIREEATQSHAERAVSEQEKVYEKLPEDAWDRPN